MTDLDFFNLIVFQINPVRPNPCNTPRLTPLRMATPPTLALFLPQKLSQQRRSHQQGPGLPCTLVQNNLGQPAAPFDMRLTSPRCCFIQTLHPGLSLGLGEFKFTEVAGLSLGLGHPSPWHHDHDATAGQTPTRSPTRSPTREPAAAPRARPGGPGPGRRHCQPR